MKGIARLLICLACCAGGGNAEILAAVIFENDGLSGGARWDAAPREVDGLERSLDGGLRFSLAGGSYAAFRDMFTWSETPSVDDFQRIVEDAFRAWTIVDPTTGLGSALSFVEDFSTPVVGPAPDEEGNMLGAEIDLLAYSDAIFWDPGDPRLYAEVHFDTTPGPIQLTSGTTNYAASAIRGADIKLNNNPEANWSIDWFRLILTHEIGHALGLGDVDVFGPDGEFLDDNYDGTTPESTLETLTNSWAALVDPLNPANSPLELYTVPNASPGFDTMGVDILMETSIPRVLRGNQTPLQDDDFGGRQFLYPSRFVEVPGDYDHDGIVGPADYQKWLDQFGKRGIGLAADGDDNGIVDAGDYIVWRNHFDTVIVIEDTSPVPEPATGIVAMLGLLIGSLFLNGRAPRPR